MDCQSPVECGEQVFSRLAFAASSRRPPRLVVVRVIIGPGARDTYEQLASCLCEPKLSDRWCCEQRLETSAVRESRSPRPQGDCFRSDIASGLCPTPQGIGSPDMETDQKQRDTPVWLAS